MNKSTNIMYGSINQHFSEHGRAMHIYSRLAEKPKVKIFWIDPPFINRSLLKIRRYKNKFFDKIKIFVPIGFPFFMNSKLLWIITENILKLYIKSIKLNFNLIIISHPIFVTYAKSLNKGVPIIYDCRDFFSKWSHYGKFTIEKEKELLSICDFVIVPTESLKEKILEINSNCRVFVIYNGVPKCMIKKCNKNHSKPKIGFVGHMGYYVDLDLIINIAKERFEWDFIFVGDHSGIKNIVVSAPMNCKFIGEVRFDDLDSILCTFDVAIIPFKQTEFTDVVFPIKLVEYFAKGIPVVSTPLRELKKLKKSHLIHFANNKREWIIEIEEALEDTRNDDFIEFAKEYTWEEATDKYMQCLRDTVQYSSYEQ